MQTWLGVFQQTYLIFSFNIQKMELDYKAGAEYWESVPSTVEGMLGGFTQLSEIDARGSATFIEEFVDCKRFNTRLACGACTCHLLD